MEFQGDGGTSNQVNPLIFIPPGLYHPACGDQSKWLPGYLIRTNAVNIGATTSFTSPATFASMPAPRSLIRHLLPQAVHSGFRRGTTSTLANPVKHTVAGRLPDQTGEPIQWLLGFTDQNIVVKPVPVAAFPRKPTRSCRAPLTVNFVNASMDGISYLWEFGYGTTSTRQTPS